MLFSRKHYLVHETYTNIPGACIFSLIEPRCKFSRNPYCIHILTHNFSGGSRLENRHFQQQVSLHWLLSKDRMSEVKKISTCLFDQVQYDIILKI